MTTFHPLHTLIPRLQHLASLDPLLADLRPDQVEAFADHVWQVLGAHGSRMTTPIDVAWAQISHRINPAVGSIRLADLYGEGAEAALARLENAIRLAAAEVVAALLPAEQGHSEDPHS